MFPTDSPELVGPAITSSTTVVDWLTVIAAFGGFTLGALIKFGLDLLLDSVRQKRQAKAIALELSSELTAIYVALQETINALRSVPPSRQGATEVHPIALLSYVYSGPTGVFRRHVGSLALPPTIVHQELVSFYSSIASLEHEAASLRVWRQWIAIERGQAPETAHISNSTVERLITKANSFRNDIPKIADQLCVFGGTQQPHPPWKKQEE